MFADTMAWSSFSVDDPGRAERFYADTLGLRVSRDDAMGGLLTLHLAGGRDVMVYPKADHTPRPTRCSTSPSTTSTGPSTS